MVGRARLLLFMAFVIVPSSPGRGEDAPVAVPARPAWGEAMARVHARFRGKAGTFAHFGDSITETLAFWTPLKYERKNAPPEMERAFRKVEAYLRPECWRDWKGPEFGNQGGRQRGGPTRTWRPGWRSSTRRWRWSCSGATTCASSRWSSTASDCARWSGSASTTGRWSSSARFRRGTGSRRRRRRSPRRPGRSAREMHVPLVDYHAEILKRRPGDWDGASEAFRAYEGYDVPTLVSRDGVHPSAPQQYQNDYSVEALRCHGYDLRSYLVLMRYAEVIDAITTQRPADRPSRVSLVKVWYPKAPPLGSPAGEVIKVATADALLAAARRVRPGGTILLADGVYPMTRTLVIATNGVTLRSSSGRRGRVVLDGGGTLGELLTIRGCTGVTVADLLIQNVRWNGIKLDSDTGVQRATIRNCVLHNIWQRAVKGVKVPEADRERLRPRGCRVEYCLFLNDRPKRYGDDPADTPQSFGGDYIGGIDVMYAAGWRIADNVFVGIRGRTGSARGAVFLWLDSRDCVVERNVVVDCDSGICLGNSFKPPDVAYHCTGVVVRNNFVTRAPENGILADFTRDCAILHNTVHDPDSRLGRLIRLVHDNDGLRVENNLLSGPGPLIETVSQVTAAEQP